jgi:exodeoxyribonuclease VII large subunit
MTEKLTLTELQLMIRDSLYISLPEMYWVIAEISEIRENYSGHCYLELIEKQSDEKNIRSKAKAIIWSSRYRFLKSFFENSTGETLRDGIKILVKIKVEYHEQFGLSLIISDIDPSFTVGEMAAKRQQVIKRLEDEGVISMNRELELPSVPCNIAVISSKNAAGYSDFINHLKGNSYGYVFNTALFDASMQGAETEHSVISALDSIADKCDLFDLVVIIRGGGSQTDLSWFDNYNIAYHITQFPLPVITGIGHERDMTVADLVAFRSLKTPTAVADFLIDCFVETENTLTGMSREITEIARKIIEKNRNRLELSRMRLIPVSRMMLSDAKENLSIKIIEIINLGKEVILKAGIAPSNYYTRLVAATKTISSNRESDLDRKTRNLITFSSNALSKNNSTLSQFESSLNILNPENVLKRGYTITSMNGKLVKTAEELKQGDNIRTVFIDGIVHSNVTEKSIK